MRMSAIAAWVVAGTAMAVMAVAQQPGGARTSPPEQLRPQQPAGAQPPRGPQIVTSRPKEPESPLAGKGDVSAALEAAKKRAAAGGKRVLVVWASGPDEEYTRNFVVMTRTGDVARLLGMEYETVWAESGASEKSAANRELAKSLGVEVKQGDEHAMLAVFDPAGKLIASKSAAGMLDEVRPRAYSALKAQDFLGANKAAQPVAKEMLDAAIAKARESKRVVLVSFGEYGDEWSGAFVRWLAQPEVATVMEKHVVVRPIDLIRDRGASEAMDGLGAKRVTSLPWFVFVGPDGKPIVASQTEKMPNIGFPTDDGEVGVFLGMLKQAAPSLTDVDSAAIRASLVEHRTGKK